MPRIFIIIFPLKSVRQTKSPLVGKLKVSIDSKEIASNFRRNYFFDTTYPRSPERRLLPRSLFVTKVIY